MRVLHAIHDFLPRHQAGSEIYAHHLCRALQARGHEVSVLCAEYDASQPQGTVVRREHDGVPVIEVVNNWAFAGLRDTYRPKDVGEALARALDEVRPDVLHVHNLLNLSLDLPRQARLRGIPTVGTLHDYTLLCPSSGQRVHVSEQHVCHEIDVERCARCFVESPFHARMRGVAPRGLGARLLSAVGLASGVPGPRDFRVRLEEVKTALRDVHLLVAPSPSLAEEYVRFGIPAERIAVSDYGFVPLTPPPRTERVGPLRIGYVGTLVWHKGVHVLLEAVAGLPSSAYELHVFGDPDVFPDYSAQLRERAQGLPVRFHGRFAPGDAADVYGGIDVLVVPSLWLENSPLVIHEAFQAGVPVIGARMGGIADLVREGEWGALYDAYSAPALRDALRAVVDDPGRVDRWRAALPAVKPIAQDAEEWERVYARATARS